MTLTADHAANEVLLTGKEIKTIPSIDKITQENNNDCNDDCGQDEDEWLPLTNDVQRRLTSRRQKKSPKPTFPLSLPLTPYLSLSLSLSLPVSHYSFFIFSIARTLSLSSLFPLLDKSLLLLILSNSPNTYLLMLQWTSCLSHGFSLIASHA